MNNDKKHTILVAPLDWGLGHATRCIPIITELLHLRHKVIIGAEGVQAELLKEAFPSIPIVALAGYRVKYSHKPSLLALKILVQLPKILRSIAYEHQWLKQVVKAHSIDLVISDNRYGLYCSEIPCVFITHQLTIKAPLKWVERLLRKINYSYINRFTVCWVPDMAGAENIAGELSHPAKMPKTPVHYINLLSRFSTVSVQQKFDLCILLSGPEPQRTVFEKLVIEQIHQLDCNILLVRGKPMDQLVPFIADHITVYNHLNAVELSKSIQESEMVVCRSGYSTLMELLALNKKMILVPTPGQTEQEYLASLLWNRNLAISVKQHDFNLKEILEIAKKFEFKQEMVEVFDINKALALISFCKFK